MSELFRSRSVVDLEYTFPPELDHISASSLKMAVRCEEQWRQRYILGKRVPPALPMLAGRADHKAIEISMSQKIDSYKDLPVNEVKGLYLQKLESDVEEAGGLGEIEIRQAETPQDKIRLYDAERRHGPEVVATYHREVSPRLQPIAVEKEFHIQVPGLPVEMYGFIDLVAAPEGAETVEELRIMVDRKRRSRSSLKIEPEWSIQAEIYQLVEPIPHDWHLSVTTKTPKVIAFEPVLRQMVPAPERSTRLLQQLVAKIGWLYQRYGPDEPWPTSGKMHPWACSYCGYRKDCWGWK